MNGTRTACLAVLAFGFVFLGTGCDKLTRSRFEMIEIGHAERYDVRRTIGDPSDELPDQWHYERVDKHLNVFVHFNDGGKVWRKEWLDAMNQEFYDSEKGEREPGTYEGARVRKINE